MEMLCIDRHLSFSTTHKNSAVAIVQLGREGRGVDKIKDQNDRYRGGFAGQSNETKMDRGFTSRSRDTMS